ncbi:MAG: hypothetical protein ACLPID_19985 [Beijerinckiaceae bacterium]
MRLRVLDEDRPGYAQLAFDSPLSQPTLALSVRSQQEGGFLGPDGAWQKAAHFFTATRIGGDAGSALYRVGPEIVNHLRELDLVQFAARDGSFRVETTWENAVPQMLPRQGGRIYREPGGMPVAPPVGLAAAGTISAPEPEPEPTPSPPPARPPSPPPLPPSPPSPPVTEFEEEAHDKDLAEEEGYERSDEFEDVPPRRDGFGELVSRYRVYWLAALAVVGLAFLGFGLYQFLPCGWFNRCVVSDDELAAKTARTCVVAKRQASRYCEVTQECIGPYLTSFPNGQARQELLETARAADKDCQDKVEKDLHQCIADLKAQGRSACDVQPTCIQPFQSLYRSGPLRAKIDDAARQALLDCIPSPNAELEALRKARQCKTDNAKKCALPGCYAAYLNAYGLTGVHKNEAQSEAVELDQSCLDEEATLDTARECAGDAAKRCAQPRCYADYLSKYGQSGVHRDEAKTEASKLESECPNPARQQKDEEESAFRSAQRCASGAAPCAVKQCYDAYQKTYCPAAAHCSDAQAEVARALQSCPRERETPAVATGKYMARSEAACGAKRDNSVVVDVAGGRISWEHEFLGIKYQWEGTIDPSGNVSAKVANFPGYTATGHFTKEGEKEIQMAYPHCATGAVPLAIIKQIQ